MSDFNVNKVAWEGNNPTWMAMDLVNNGIIKNNSYVLDLGCGFGRNSNYFASIGATVDAIDIDEDELNFAKSRAKKLQVNVNYINSDVGSLPFLDNRFDVVYDGGCTHMCDLEKQLKAIKEISRVLKHKGYLMYFGFSKEHPAFVNNQSSPMFRNLEDIKEQYGKYFEIFSYKKSQWNTKPKEKSPHKKHVGLEILMRKI